MNRSLVTTNGLFLSLAILQPTEGIAANQKKNHEAHQSSCSSSSSSDREFHAYASVYNPVAETLTAETAVINFPNDVILPTRIVHPVLGDNSKLKVRHAGVYLIAWNMTLTFPTPLPATDVVTINLLNATTSNIFPSTTGTVALSANNPTDTLSGQTIVRLPANTVVQLQVISQNGGSVVNIPSLIITEIAL